MLLSTSLSCLNTSEVQLQCFLSFLLFVNVRFLLKKRLTLHFFSPCCFVFPVVDVIRLYLAVLQIF